MGYEVVGIDNLSSGDISNMTSFRTNPNFDFVEADISDRSVEDKIEGDVDSLFHLAAISSIKMSTENALMLDPIQFQPVFL